MPHGGQHPTEESINIVRKFLGGEVGNPGQPPGQQSQGIVSPQGGRELEIPASARMRTPLQQLVIDTQQGASTEELQEQAERIGRQRSRSPTRSFDPTRVPGTPPVRQFVPGPVPGNSLSDRLIDLPGPAGFAQTPQGQSILQRILGRGGPRRF